MENLKLIQELEKTASELENLAMAESDSAEKRASYGDAAHSYWSSVAKNLGLDSE